jgi:PIN domain nuclease of toxin-antitoxin system
MNFLRLLESGDLGLRFLITLLFVSLLIALGSFKKENPKRNTYTYFVISMVVFFLCFTLNTIDLNLGMALGLFAIFGIIRYRTETIKAQEMTYLFAFIGLAVINSLAPFDPVSELLPLNILITLSIAAAQKVLLDRDIEVAQKEKLSKTVVVLPFNREDVFEQAVLKERIELKIKNKIKRMDLSRIDEELNQITYTIYH